MLFWRYIESKVACADYVCHIYMLKYKKKDFLTANSEISMRTNSLTEEEGKQFSLCRLKKKSEKPLHDLTRGQQSVFTPAAPAAALPVAICSGAPASTTWMIEAKHLQRENLLPATQKPFIPPLFLDLKITVNILYCISIAQSIIAPNAWTVAPLLLIVAYPHISVSTETMNGWKLTGKAENQFI